MAEERFQASPQASRGVFGELRHPKLTSTEDGSRPIPRHSRAPCDFAWYALLTSALPSSGIAAARAIPRPGARTGGVVLWRVRPARIPHDEEGLRRMEGQLWREKPSLLPSTVERSTMNELSW